MPPKPNITLTPERFAELNGLKFREPRLLVEALTHRSYLNEHDDPGAHDNERLEFLGDTVLDFVTGDLLYKEYPEWKEGALTRIRAAIVRTESLAELGRAAKIGEALRMGKGEELNGGRKRVNNLCGAFEAVIGALYLDQGIEGVRAFAIPRIRARLERVLEESLDLDARSALQELTQGRFNVTPEYQLVNVSGPDHEREFTVEVTIGGQSAGVGTGHSKRAASMAAARSALVLVESGAFTFNADSDPNSVIPLG